MELILFLLSGTDQSGSLGLIYASCSFLKELVLPEAIRNLRERERGGLRLILLSCRLVPSGG